MAAVGIPSIDAVSERKGTSAMNDRAIAQRQGIGKGIAVGMAWLLWLGCCGLALAKPPAQKPNTPKAPKKPVPAKTHEPALPPPEICTPLEAIGGTGTVQTKTVSPPGVPFIPFVPFVSWTNNWNTDFAVPGGKIFRRFVVKITPRSNATYGVEVNLKYSNGTYDQAYKQTIQLVAGSTLELSGVPRPDDLPYQVNVLVGGMEGGASGSTYDLGVFGCQ